MTKAKRELPGLRAGHHPLSPSGAHRWFYCHAAPWLEEMASQFGEELPASEAAQEGTNAHAEAEQVLRGKKPACVEYPEAQDYVDYVREYLIDPLIEVELSFSDYVPGGKGTADAMGVQGNVLHVIDLKYGKGVRVDAHENLQGKIYLLGALQTIGFAYDFNKMHFHIMQPRLDHVSVAEYTRDEIIDFGKTLKRTVETMLTSKELIASPGEETCRWCTAGAVCTARAEWVMSIARCEFDSVCDDDLDPSMELHLHMKLGGFL